MLHTKWEQLEIKPNSYLPSDTKATAQSDLDFLFRTDSGRLADSSPADDNATQPDQCLGMAEHCNS